MLLKQRSANAFVSSKPFTDAVRYAGCLRNDVCFGRDFSDVAGT